MSTGKRWGRMPDWYLDAREREPFMAAIRDICPDTEARLSAKGYQLRFTINVDHYAPRKVLVVFLGDAVGVFADGPTDSPHRWNDGMLCMWHPDDPASRRWIRQFGAALLIDMIRTHLFREAYWRETDHWPGEEAPHDAPRRAGRSKPR